MLLTVMVATTVSGQDSLNNRLILAAGRGQLATVRGLIGQGANVNAHSADGNTALIKAVHTRRTGVVQLLVAKGADVNGKTRNGFTALLAAAY